MKYLSAQEVLVLHARIIDKTGGTGGVRDVGLLESACMRPQATFGGKQLHQAMFTKVAALLHSLARNHPFLDGNKRTAIVAASRMLHVNGYELTADNRDVVAFMLGVAQGQKGIQEIAEWLKANSKKHAKK